MEVQGQLERLRERHREREREWELQLQELQELRRERERHWFLGRRGWEQEQERQEQLERELEWKRELERLWERMQERVLLQVLLRDREPELLLWERVWKLEELEDSARVLTDTDPLFLEWERLRYPELQELRERGQEIERERKQASMRLIQRLQKQLGLLTDLITRDALLTRNLHALLLAMLLFALFLELLGWFILLGLFATVLIYIFLIIHLTFVSESESPWGLKVLPKGVSTSSRAISKNQPNLLFCTSPFAFNIHLICNRTHSKVFTLDILQL